MNTQIYKIKFKICPDCDGRGRSPGAPSRFRDYCKKCDGSGRIKIKSKKRKKSK